LDRCSADELDNELFASVLVLAWRRYQFYMTAVNQLGESELSEPASAAQCVTPASAPSRNPSNVCTRLQANKQLVIVWQVTQIRAQQSLILTLYTIINSRFTCLLTNSRRSLVA